MRTIAFVSQKGGSGKSTIASSVAVAAHQMDEKVCVIDMDPQGSLTNWARIRAAGDIEVLASGAAAAASFTRFARAPGRDARAPRHAWRGRRSVFGRDASRRPEYRSFPPKPVRFVGQRPNVRGARGDRGQFRVPAQPMPGRSKAARVQDGVEALEEMGRLISPLIRARVEYQDAARRGRGVTELNPSGAAAQEMRSLWQSITADLAEVKVGQPRPERGLRFGQTKIGSPAQALVPALEMA